MSTRPTNGEHGLGDGGSRERGGPAPPRDDAVEPDMGDAQAAAMAGVHAEDLGQPGDDSGPMGTDLAGPDLSGLGPGLGAPLDQRD